MTLAIKLLSDVRDAGGHLFLNGNDELEVVAPEPLPNELVDCLRQHKSELVEALTGGKNSIAASTGEFEVALARLCAMKQPTGASSGRWQQLMDDAREFVSRWSHNAASLGWKPNNTFALHGGLIPLIEGGVIMAISDGWAIIRSQDWHEFRTCRFCTLLGETAPSWRVWTAVCEPRGV